jgi:hypothetical protein
MVNLPDSQWKESTTPMFGHMCDFESLVAADEYEMMVSYLKSKQVEIRPLDKSEVEIVVSGDPDRDVSSQPYSSIPNCRVPLIVLFTSQVTVYLRFIPM